jgi:hypothetical protein
VYIAFITDNTLGKHLLGAESNNNADICNKCGIYKLKCDGVYVGQTDRSFRIRYTGHLNYMKCNRDEMGIFQHIRNTKHEFSKDITSLEVLDVCSKSPF